MVFKLMVDVGGDTIGIGFLQAKEVVQLELTMHVVQASSCVSDSMPSWKPSWIQEIALHCVHGRPGAFGAT